MEKGRIILVTAPLLVTFISFLLYSSFRKGEKKSREEQDDDCPRKHNTETKYDPRSKLSNGMARKRHACIPSHLKRKMYKEDRFKQMTPLLTMKRVMYDNIQMKDPDSIILCTVSLKKARWYVKKNLAEWQTDSCIRLLFKPDVSNEKDPGMVRYNTSVKENQCVVCGQANEYMRHYIVPYCYRSLFPVKFKTHLPHDIVLLCPQCHVRAERLVHKRMQRLEDSLRTDPETEHPDFVDHYLHSVRSSALALLRWSERIPSDRIREHEQAIRSWFGLNDDEELGIDHLERAAEIESRIPNPKYIAGAEIVRKSLGTDDAIETFVRDWREFFLESMRPRYLPVGWAIDLPVRCDDRKG